MRCLVVQPQEMQLAAILCGKTVSIICTRSSKELVSIEAWDDGFVFCISYSPDGQQLVVGGTFGVDLFDTLTGNKVRSFRGEPPSLRLETFKCFIDTRQRFLVAANHAGINVYHLASGDLQYKIQKGGCDVALSTNGERFAYSEFGKTGVTICRIEDGEQQMRFARTPPGIGLYFSPDQESEFLMCIARKPGTWLAGELTFYSTKSAEELRHSKLFRALMFPPAEICGHCIGFAPLSAKRLGVPEHVFAGIGSTFFLADLRYFVVAARDGAFSAQQLVWLTDSNPELIPDIANQFPHRVNSVRDDQYTKTLPQQFSCGLTHGETVLHHW